jgi:uncharacterized protein (DUF58 family)
VSWYPGRRLGIALWGLAAGALLAAWWPALLPLLAGAILVLLGLVGLDASTLWRLPWPEAEREIPERVWVGREAEIAIRVRNPATAATRLDVIDELPEDLAAADPVFASVEIAPRSQERLAYQVRPRERGDRALGALTLLQHSSIGLLRRRRIVQGDQQLRVYPDASRYLRREALDAKRTLAVLGVKPARRPGEGIEFETLREYVPGDDPRRLDWAATARRGRPITRVFQHERNHSVWIALDTSRLMGERCGERSKLDGAIDAALALAFASVASGDRVGALVFDRELRGATAARGRRSQLGVILELLRRMQPRRVEADYATLLHALAARQRALVVVFTDFVESFASQMSDPLVVLAKRHRVLVVAVRSPLFGVLADRSDVGSSLDLYGRIVVDDLLREREEALARLRQLGVLTLDATPDQVVAPVVNRYLQLRSGPER